MCIQRIEHAAVQRRVDPALHENLRDKSYAYQVLELRERGLSTKIIALANAAWIRYMTGKGPIWGDAILGVSFFFYVSCRNSSSDCMACLAVVRSRVCMCVCVFVDVDVDVLVPSPVRR